MKKETENYIYQNKLPKAQTGKKQKKNLEQCPNWGLKQWNKTNKYVERKGKKIKKERIDMQS